MESGHPAEEDEEDEEEEEEDEDEDMNGNDAMEAWDDPEWDEDEPETQETLVYEPPPKKHKA